MTEETKTVVIPLVLLGVTFSLLLWGLNVSQEKKGFYDCKAEREQIFECLGNLSECRMEDNK